MLSHENNVLGPGSSWINSGSELLIPQHKITYNCLLSDAHYHVFVKYCFGKALLQSDDEKISFWRNIYNRMQLTRIGIAKPDKFEELIYSFQRNGYKKINAIPVNRDYDILDGSHRLAIAILFNLFPLIEVYNHGPHSYNRDWFVSNNFSPDDLAKIDLAKKSIMVKSFVDTKKLNLGIIWGMSLKYWNEIVDIFSKYNIKCCFIYNFNNINKAIEFVMETYKGDGMIYKRIKAKAENLSKKSTQVGLILFKKQQKETRIMLKKLIRDKYSPLMKDYFFDSILHFIDCNETELEIMNSFSNVYSRLSSPIISGTTL